MKNVPEGQYVYSKFLSHFFKPHRGDMFIFTMNVAPLEL